MKILGTGLSGLLGTRIVELLSDFEFTSLSRTSGVNITDYEALENHIKKFKGKFVLHMAAKADVDGCEKDKELGESGEAWQINVNGTENIADLCRRYGKKIIYISTDFVFDGEKNAGEFYAEEDAPHPVNWYGETKYKGELATIQSGAESVILRIAYPYGISSSSKKDFVRIIADRLKNGQPVKAVTDHIFVPTFIDDIAFAIKKIVEENLQGIFHVVGSSSLTPYDAAYAIAKITGSNPSIIEKTTRSEFFSGRALRPFNLHLSNDKIKNLGISMSSFEEGIEKMSEIL